LGSKHSTAELHPLQKHFNLKGRACKVAQETNTRNDADLHLDKPDSSQYMKATSLGISRAERLEHLEIEAAPGK
jgi:hypothetical protein